MICEQSNKESYSNDPKKPYCNIEVIFPVLLSISLYFFEENVLVIIKEVVIIARLRFPGSINDDEDRPYYRNDKGEEAQHNVSYFGTISSI